MNGSLINSVLLRQCAALVCGALLLGDFAHASGGAAPKKAAKSGGHGTEKKAAHGEKKSGHGDKKSSAHGAKKPAAHGEAKAAGGHGAASGGHGAAGEKKEYKPDPTYAPELAELLHLIESKDKKHDPKTLVELELGKFKLTRGNDHSPRLLNVSFQLYAIVAEDRLEEVSLKIPEREQRLRDAVLSAVHEATDDELNEPSMPILKQRLVVEINRVLEVVEVRDLAFSDFSTKFQ
jgi:flagellar basal body-associated protein FliL